MWSEGHRPVPHEGLDALYGHGVSSADQHCQYHETEHAVVVHHPEEDRKDLEESERVDDLVTEYALKGSNWDFQDVIIVKLLLIFPLS